MVSTDTTIKNLANQYKNYPPGCVPCPHGSRPGNPGTFEELHRKFEVLEPKNFDGLRLTVKKILSKHFKATHTININSKCPSLFARSVLKEQDYKAGYKFGASYVGTKKVGYRERYPIVCGDITPKGDLNANFIHTLGCRCRIKFSTQIKKNIYQNSRATIEYRTDDCTISASLVDPLILKGEGLFLFQILQAITSRITLGAEIACHKSSQFPEGKQANFALACRYSNGFKTLSATFSPAGVRCCYHQRQSHQLQMGVEFQCNVIKREAQARLLSRLDLPRADLVFHSFFDTHFRIGATFEKKLYPMPEASLLLSGILDHCQQNVSVGIGLSVGE